MSRPFVAGPEDGRASRLGGDLFVVKARGADTGGAYSVTEMTVPPHAQGPHTHHHEAAEEAFYVMEGTLRLVVGDAVIEAHAGTFAVVPRGQVHTYTNPTDRPARVLVLISPPGFEQFFIENGEPAKV